MPIDRRVEVGLVLAALGAAFLSFNVTRPGAAVVAAILVGLIGMGRGLPLSLAVATSAAAGSALVHFAVAPEHFAEWWGFGLFFVVCAEVQLGWALLLRRRCGGAGLAVGIVGSLLLVAVWGLSRTRGLPFGPEPGVPEAVSIPDVLSVLLELITAAACAWALVGQSRKGARTRAATRALCVAAAFALTAWALAAVGAS
jgi:hypothetical protein